MNKITIKALNELEKIIKEEKSDIVLVHGDTTTIFVGVLPVFYNQVAIVHVESGLRINDEYLSYLEVMNR